MTESLGRYKILEKIGEGGFAIVYRAHDLELDRLVALKELRSLLLTNATWVKRFHREAKAIARLDHPHIVTIYDIWETEGRQFIVMRLVDGSSLDEIIAKQKGLTWSEAAEIAIATAQGLDYAHVQGILHRDLKPGNILIDSERGPMLTDFGFAKLAGESSRSVTVSGDIVGTPSYIAPEAWEGEEVTPQADIYALGCILYEMITGEQLFQGETPPAVMMAHFKPLTLPSSWPESVPDKITDILTKALARRPAERYATAGEMVQALAELVNDTRPTVSAAIVQAEGVSLESKAAKPAPTPPIAVEKTAIGSISEEAKMWQQKAEKALAEGNLEAAQSAVYQWQELMPAAPDLIAFKQRLEEYRQQTEPAPVSTATPQVVIVKEERRRRGCLWVGGAVGIGLAIFLILSLGRLCSTLNTTIANILPKVEVGELVKESIHISGPEETGVVNLDIEFGSGELIVRPGAKEALVDGTVQYNVAQLEPKIEIEKDEIRLRHENPIGLASFTTSNLKNVWDLKLSNTPMALTIDTGAARGDLELGGLSLTSLKVTQGAANFELSFSEPNQIEMDTFEFKGGGSIVNLTGLANTRTKEIIFQGGFGDFTLDFGGQLQGDINVIIDGGVGSFILIIPEGVAAQVTVDSENSDVDAQGNWQVTDNIYTLSGTGHRIMVNVSAEGGNVRLRNR